VPLAAFLTASTATSSFAAHPHFAHGSDSAGEELARLVAQLGEHGHRAIVVDVTTPWTHALGLYAVRVVVPGLQPMHFGRARRVLGGRRLYEAPRRMGVRDADTRLEDLNPWEHPFA
jgi:ribosomal protein S12 methylthiotransferase accessory factor